MEFLNFFNWYTLIFIIFIVFIVINIFPLMFFLVPEIFILAVFWLCVSWKISFLYWFLAMFLWSVLWETFSYYLWYRWINIDKYKNQKLNDFFIHFKKNEVKYLIIWKLLPFITWLIPVLAWIIKMNFIKFFIINTFIVFYSLFITFIFLYFWNKVIDKYFFEYKFEIVLFIFVILFISLFIKIYKNKLWKKS